MAFRVNITYKERRANDERSSPGSAERAPTASLNYEDVQSLFAARSTLQARLDSLEALLRRPQSDSRLALKTLGEIRSSAAVLSWVVDDIDSVVPVASRPSDRSAHKANEVFDVPELLEQILLPLTPKELLQAQQVTRAFYNTIEGSTKLQEALSLRPNRNGFYRTLFGDGCLSKKREDFPGLTVRCRMITKPDSMARYGYTPRRVESAALALKAGFRQGCALPKLGSRARSMLICQPPLQQITICVTDMRRIERFHPRPQAERIEMTVPTGLTVGDMADAMLEVRSQYLQDHSSKASSARSPSFSNALSIHFEGRVDLVKEDPLFPNPLKPLAEMRSKDSKYGHGVPGRMLEIYP